MNKLNITITGSFDWESNDKKVVLAKLELLCAEYELALRENDSED